MAIDIKLEQLPIEGEQIYNIGVPFLYELVVDVHILLPPQFYFLGEILRLKGNDVVVVLKIGFNLAGLPFHLQYSLKCILFRQPTRLMLAAALLNVCILRPYCLVFLAHTVDSRPDRPRLYFGKLEIFFLLGDDLHGGV